MFIAKDETFRRVLKGSESDSRAIVQSNLTCPICDEEVRFNPSPDHRLGYFDHPSPDCFKSDGVSDEHRLCTEVTVAEIANRLSEISGSSTEIDIDVERRIGTRSDFVITDVRVERPLQISAEIFYQAQDIDLRRRLSTLSSNGYRTFLIFHVDGVHNINLVDEYIQRISSLSIGRFDPATTKIDLGDLFSYDQVDFKQRTSVPKYII